MAALASESAGMRCRYMKCRRVGLVGDPEQLELTAHHGIGEGLARRGPGRAAVPELGDPVGRLEGQLARRIGLQAQRDRAREIGRNVDELRVEGERRVDRGLEARGEAPVHSASAS